MFAISFAFASDLLTYSICKNGRDTMQFIYYTLSGTIYNGSIILNFNVDTTIENRFFILLPIMFKNYWDRKIQYYESFFIVLKTLNLRL